ncbi:MAG: VOC family protein [Dehalococcoidia bacterium]|jgi:methylmalonyl-CoA/ethylmalonyl-CoA epimerase
MSKRLDHVGILVSNIDEALKLYSKMLGLTPWDKGIVEIPEKGVKVVLFQAGENAIELIEPTDPKSPEAETLRQRGEGLWHLSIFIDDFDSEVRALKAKGFPVKEEEIKSLFPGYTLRLAWLLPEDTRGVRIELVDAASDPKN